MNSSPLGRPTVRIPLCVAERVVHTLEVVQVDEEHRQSAAYTLRVHEGVLESVVQHIAIGQSVRAS